MSRDTKILGGIGILTLAIVIIAAFTIGNKPGKEEKAEVLGESQMKLLIREDTHLIKGNNAKVTIVEFGDFQCPACSTAHAVNKVILKEYKGKINFAFREFPLTMHKNGYISSLAAEAAGGQGKFWQMYDLLYENQDEWSGAKDPVNIFEGYAKKIGIDTVKFKNDIKDKKYDSKIKEDMDDGFQIGINSTPTYYINGKEYAGALDYDEFKSIIDEAMK